MSEPTETAEPDHAEDDSVAHPPPRPRARERGRMRRRLRQQRGMREALLVDLGALVFELHRHGRREPELLQAKAAELTAVDHEVRALSEALGQDLGVAELVAAGIAGTCPDCGSLMSVDARFCSTCGRGLKPGLQATASEETAAREPAEAEAVETAPEAPDEQLLAADMADEPEAFEDPETDILAEPEPDPEPEPQLARAPWLADEDEPPLAPQEPVRMPRRQGRLERALRGKSRQ